MTERWLPVVGYEGFYEVSDRGDVRSLYSGKLLKICIDRYPVVNLHRDGSGRAKRVHILVLEAFAGSRPPGMVSRHLNDIPADNRWPENLAWGTYPENGRDTVRNGNHCQANKTHCPAGHSYESENLKTGVRGEGGTFRRCLICCRKQSREATRRRRAALKAAA